MDRLRGGKIFPVFYSGGKTEGIGNYIILAVSEDDGRTRTDPCLMICHES